jgi:hypothetical protein
MNASLNLQKRYLLWLFVAVLFLMGLLALVLTTSGISLAGLNVFDQASLPQDFILWGIDANRFIF